jgi:hypothetical protein
MRPRVLLADDYVKPSYLGQLELSLLCHVGSMSCCIKIITTIHLWELRASG